MTKKQVTKISDKLAKANDTLSVHIYDNGFMVEVSGRASDDDWKTAKIMCSTLDELMAVIKEATEMERE